MTEYGFGMLLRRAIGLLLTFHAVVMPAWAGSTTPLDENGCREAFRAVLRPPLLRAEFTQEKTLPDVARTLRTKGELLVSAEYGVILRTLSPEFATSTKVMPLRPKADERRDIEARISRMIRSVLAGEYAPLTEFFTLQGRREGARAIITLTPKSPEVRSALRSIELSFGTYLEEVVLDEAAGSKVRLAFTGFRQTPALTADELGKFAEASAR